VHVPVLVDEVTRWLLPERGGTFVDCTVGLGGHARALCERGATRLIGIDRDPSALAHARETLSSCQSPVSLVHSDYRELPRVLDSLGIDRVDGAVADLGVSSLQLDADGRGFSFRRDEPLDMRMDTSQGETLADRLAAIGETELADVIYQLGEERHSRRIARAIVTARSRAPVVSTGQLAAIVRRATPSKGWQRIDPATRTFQALRIWVNGELEGLDGFLEAACGRLRPGGRLAVISFHSLEDRIVKHTFRALGRSEGDRPAVVRVLTKRPETPGEDEERRNPRARSAKLRVVERV
jgi:16S rRNA (cytosine1402-N4)-methyltransferase